MKQIIVIRNDLNMRKGKMVAQGAHASLNGALRYQDDRRVKTWLSGAFTKVVVRVDSEEQLYEIAEAAKQADLLVSEVITDSGKTEFHGVATPTAVAIGPDTDDKLQPITGHLKLL